jgi:ABC-type uncharacterized transport system substrate-binding protein
MIVTDYDCNQNNQLEPSEITIIQSEAFDSLVEYDYFTFIKICGRSFKVTSVQDFSASLIVNQLIYQFFILCPVSGDSVFKEIIISQYDPTYYSNVALEKKQPIVFENEEGFETRYHIIVNKKEAYYYDQIHPVEIILQFKRKDG